MVKVQNLTKYYNGHCAIRDISFDVEDGQVYGLLGPNGAGKSTIMNIMTGYISCTTGSVEIDGYDILKQPHQAKERIGYLPEIPPLYMDMTPREYLEFIGKLRSVEKNLRREQIDSIMEQTSITEVRNRIIKTLSKGYRQRIGLAGALVGSPKLIILDEPTVGLDPAQMIEVRNLISSLGRDHTVILSSHILSEVQAVCDRVLIIAEGQLIAMGTPQELADRMQSGKILRVTAKGNGEHILAAIKKIAGLGAYELVEQEGELTTFTVSLPGTRDLRPAVSEALVYAGCPAVAMQTSSASLEEIFLQLVENDSQIMQAEG